MQIAEKSAKTEGFAVTRYRRFREITQKLIFLCSKSILIEEKNHLSNENQ